MTVGKPVLRSDGRWTVRARISPGPKGRISGYGPTGDEATADALEKARLAIQAKTELSLPGPTFRAFPAGSLARFVWETWWPKVHPGIKPPTRRKYNSLLKHHILPSLGLRPIAAIGYEEMKAMSDSLRRHDKRPGDLSPKQKGEAIILAREILDFNHKLAGARKEPTREDWRLVSIPKRSKKKKRLEAAPDFTQKLLAACKPHEVGPHFAALFLGLRRGEVCGLTKNKIDRRALTIHVSEQLQPETGDELVSVKGGEDRARTIPVPEALLDMLEALSSPDSEYVFLAPRPGKGRHAKGFVPPMLPILPNELSKWTPAICARAGVKRTTFHDLRSQAASNLAGLGVDLLVIMEILGHTEIDTTLIYANAKSQIKRQALKKLFATLPKSAQAAVKQGVINARHQPKSGVKFTI